jgi:hypothetical protein
MAFAQSIKVRRMIEGIALDPKQTFWIMTVNLLADAASIEWSKVFGSWGDDTHWTRIIPKDKHVEVRAALLSELGISEAEWEAYRKEIVGYRNEIVAHHDLNATIAKYPHYDKAIVAANFMFDRLRSTADPDQLGSIPTSLDRWSDTVAGNMSVIVRRAFQASASLGSNVPGAA